MSKILCEDVVENSSVAEAAPVSPEHLKDLKRFNKELYHWEFNRKKDDVGLLSWKGELKDFLGGLGQSLEIEEYHRSVFHRVISDFREDTISDVSKIVQGVRLQDLIDGKKPCCRPISHLVGCIARGYGLPRPLISTHITSQGRRLCKIVEAVREFHEAEGIDFAYHALNRRGVSCFRFMLVPMALSNPKERLPMFLGDVWHESGHSFQWNMLHTPSLYNRYPVESAYLALGANMMSARCLEPYYDSELYNVCPMEVDAQIPQDFAESWALDTLG